MRRFSVMMAAFAVILSVSLLSGQQPRPGGFGGPGGGADPANLVKNPQIQKELDLSEEQLEKLPAAFAKALKDVLDDKQMKRLNQITLQQKGIDAFRDKKVQKDLKISSEQIENIETVLNESRKEAGKLFGGGGARPGADAFEKLRTMRKETQEKVMDILTSDQRKAYKQMVGEEFKMEFPRFGGTFGKKGDKKDEK